MSQRQHADGSPVVSKSVAALTDILRQDQPADICWLWPGPWNRTTNGYGVFTYNWVKTKAHRIVYELLVGPIADGFTIDHVCHNEALARGECVTGVCDHRRCVNPAHLEAVPHLVNLMRGGSYDFYRHHCPKGHLLDEANTYWPPGVRGGRRYCRICLNHEPAVSNGRGDAACRSCDSDSSGTAGRSREGNR